MGQFILDYKKVRPKGRCLQTVECRVVGCKAQPENQEQMDNEVSHTGKVEPLAATNASQEQKTCCVSYY